MLLPKFESLFDGTVGNTEPIDLELKDPEAKPYHASKVISSSSITRGQTQS
jgi:hypothetical protein